MTRDLIKALHHLSFDGIDLNYEVEGVSAVHIDQYKNVIKATRMAVRVAGNSRMLSLAGWATGADCTDTTGTKACGGKTSYWAGNAGRERTVFSDPTMAKLVDMVSVMSYDLRYENFDAVMAYTLYRTLFPPSVIVNIGFKTAPESVPGALLVVEDKDAQCLGSVILNDQYGDAVNQPYSVNRLALAPLSITTQANPRDGAMLWEVTRTTAGNCAQAPLASPGSVRAKIASMYALPLDPRSKWQ